MLILDTVIYMRYVFGGFFLHQGYEHASVTLEHRGVCSSTTSSLHSGTKNRHAIQKAVTPTWLTNKYFVNIVVV